MSKSKWLIILGTLVLAALMVVGCTTTPETVIEKVIETVVVEGEVQTVIQTVEVEVEGETVIQTVVVEVEVMATPEPSTRKGAWVDMVVVIEEPSDAAAISRLEAGDMDVYAYTVAKADLLQTVDASANLKRINSFGSYNELTFNPVGPTFEATGKLNPFSSAKFREAMNWLIDRDYIAQEVTGGMAIPRFFSFAPTFADYAKYADLAAATETYYAYNKDKAAAVIEEEMTAMGATKEGGMWMFNGEPVEIIGLIRTEDERLLIGNYVATELESLGFTLTRVEKRSADLSPLWTGDPNLGLWHYYTGGWITTAVPRTEEDNFTDFYMPDGWPGNPLWDNYVNEPEYAEKALALYNRQYSTLEERRELFAYLIPQSLKEAQRVWTTNRVSFAPLRAEVSVVGNLAGSIAGSTLWPYTLRRLGEEGGALTMGMPSILTEVWNPINGSNWIYDQALTRATMDWGVIGDPWTGLALPQRVNRAEVVAQEGLPIGVTLDWVDFSFAPEVVVPADAFIDWDPETQTFLTVGEVYTQPLTAAIKSVAYYGDELADVTWHDGSPFDVADILFYYIQLFDRGMEASAYFDPAAATTLKNFQATFRGFRITSVDPLVFEYYTDNWFQDAELNVAAPFGNYGYGPGAWHMMSIGFMGEADGAFAFSKAKAASIEKEWLNYISGPTLEILSTYLVTATAETFIPYAPTLGQYITADEAATRWANYTEWYRARGHFWIGTGPLYLERAFPVEGMVVLKNYTKFVDLSEKWAGYGEPPIPVIDIEGPASVKVGDAAEFEVYISFADEPYALDDILSVSYLVFGPTGDLVTKGDAEGVEDGLFSVALTAEQSGALTVGSNKLTLVVVSKLLSIPGFESLDFVTTQ
jgi:peptide/nickel transport system substrate-binding protein